MGVDMCSFFRPLASPCAVHWSLLGVPSQDPEDPSCKHLWWSGGEEVGSADGSGGIGL